MIGATRPRETRRVLVVDVQYVSRPCLICVENPERRSRGDRDPEGGVIDLQPIGDPCIVEEARSEFRLVTPRIPSDDNLLKLAFDMPSHRSAVHAVFHHSTADGIADCGDGHPRLL